MKLFVLALGFFIFIPAAFGSGKYCNGVNKTFAGIIQYPNKASTRFAGQPAYPNKESIFFAGRLQYPNELSLTFAGSFQYMNGQSITYAGQLVYPDRQVMKDFSGRCFYQNGDQMDTCPSEIIYRERNGHYDVKGYLSLEKQFATYLEFEENLDENTVMLYDLDIANETILNVGAFCF